MKDSCFLTLNIGTETVKSLVFKKSGKKLYILGKSLQPFDKFGVFESRNFQEDVVKKAVSRAVKESQKQAKVKPASVLLSLPANILKARVIFQSFKRDDSKKEIQKKEAEDIQQIVLREVQKRILPRDFQFLTLKILEIKIDGYLVPRLPGFCGKNLDFKILTTFLSKNYLKDIKKIAQVLRLKNLKIINLAENLTEILDDKKLEGIFLDIGGDLTQIFVVKKGKLEKVDEFGVGGKDFLRELSQTFGINLERAGNLLQNYLKGVLSDGVKKRIKQIFKKVAERWLRNLKLLLKGEKVLPQNILLFGGGSLLPEIQEVLKKGDWQDILFENQPKVKILYPKDLKNIEDETKSLNSPQNTFSLLLCQTVLK